MEKEIFIGGLFFIMCGFLMDNVLFMLIAFFGSITLNYFFEDDTLDKWKWLKMNKFLETILVCVVICVMGLGCFYLAGVPIIEIYVESVNESMDRTKEFMQNVLFTPKFLLCLFGFSLFLTSYLYFINNTLT